MSWLLENWFGSKESLEQVREDIRGNLQGEVYLGLSGIENPEQSSNRVPSENLFVLMNGPWESALDETESELLQYIHNELPPIVRDEVGIFPFYTQVTAKGYLVLAYIRNATDRSVLLQKLTLSLSTPEGEVVCKKVFDMIPFGPVGDMSSRPCEFLFRWEEFSKIPDQEVPLILSYTRTERLPKLVTTSEQGSLDDSQLEQYSQKVAELEPLADGQVDLQVLDVKAGDDDGLKVVVVFRNGVSKRLEFTQVPILVHDQFGERVAKVNFTLENMKVEGKSHKVWAFDIPASSLRRPVPDPGMVSAVIPKAVEQKKTITRIQKVDNKGFLQ